MCGFVGIFDIQDGKATALRKQLLQMSRKIRHRGPDWSGVFECPRALISHERLAIIDPLSGKQPLYSPDGRYVLAVNGEIYNHNCGANWKAVTNSRLNPTAKCFCRFTLNTARIFSTS